MEKKMKKTMLIAAMCLCFPVMAFSAEITFVIKQLRNAEGVAIVAIFDDEIEWEKENDEGGKPLVTCENNQPIANNEVRVVCDIKPGTYAATLMHDENSNGEFDTNFFGLPEEGYGFSNDAEAGMSMPDFKEATFTVDTEDKELIINATY
jgi:uncharacterized protein (DUF2141 family)